MLELGRFGCQFVCVQNSVGPPGELDSISRYVTRYVTVPAAAACSGKLHSTEGSAYCRVAACTHLAVQDRRMHPTLAPIPAPHSALPLVPHPVMWSCALLHAAVWTGQGGSFYRYTGVAGAPPSRCSAGSACRHRTGPCWERRSRARF
jgi:hypothetical protein